MSRPRLTMLLKPWRGTALMLMTGTPSRSSRRARSAPALAGAGEENPFEADAGAPAPLEHFTHELARRVGERDVQHEEDRPDRLRDLELSAGLGRRTREVHRDVEGDHDAEEHGEDAA